MRPKGRVVLVQSIENAAQSAHVVVLGNEKGGSGNSTTVMDQPLQVVASHWRHRPAGG
jgi:ATPase MipZ